MKKIFDLRLNLLRWCSLAPMKSGSPTCLLTVMLFLVLTPGYSQQPEMADTMRSEGKIYVVVAILLLILVGLIGYLVMIDRKATRLERKLEEKESS